ncbi:MAG: hypothetical protein KDC35_13795 [Acidobacteria bacterium]|nr:hypothetical protein [Acidobacteriota bacterium]
MDTLSIESLISNGARRYERLAGNLKRRIDRLAVLRVCVFFTLLASFSFAVSGHYQIAGSSLTLLMLAIFLALIFRHDRVYRALNTCRARIGFLNDDRHRIYLELDKVPQAHEWHCDPNHSFAHDLDLTGSRGLFKLLNCAHLSTSVDLLARWIEGAPDNESLRQRQFAARELAPQTGLRMKLRTATYQHRNVAFNETPWLNVPAPSTINPVLLWPATILGTTATVLIGMRFLFGVEGLPWPLVSLVALVAYAWFGFRQRSWCESFLAHQAPLRAAKDLAAVLKAAPFHSKPLEDIQESLRQTNALQQLAEIEKVADGLSYRANALAHFLINFSVQWDAWHLKRLDAWRERSGGDLGKWFDALTSFEAHASLSHFQWLHPDYVRPDVTDDPEITFSATGLGHPLIPPSKRVVNDYEISGAGKIHLLTGSNMSGKSTFLRTVGTNWVLARMGAPVCAQSLTCSTTRIWTSIRIQDSLDQGVSFFYAEVLRLKAILEATKIDHPPVFFLLDEILRGTNSRERLIACKAAVRYLTERNTSGIITTHDLELLDLADQFPDQIAMFHFQETIQGESMFFDYQLHPDELTSTNALRVMQAAGLPLVFD